MNTTAPSGTQLRISHAGHHAVVTTVGATLRAYSVDGRPVVVPFPEEAIAPASHGAVLAPWPNRLGDGAYTWEGRELVVPITEHGRRTALHGLVCWQAWSVVEQAEASVTLELALPATPGYPFSVTTRITYTLSDAGLEIVATATNTGAGTAPYGIGFHPWLSPGDAEVDECTLRLDATTRVTTDDRLLPTGTEPAQGGYDFTAPRSLVGADLDDAYVDVVRDADGLSWMLLAAPDGRTSAVWMDGSMDTWQVCTGDHIGAEGYVRTGVAAEPMSCLADAFRTGDRLTHLAPTETFRVRWGLALL